LVCENAAAAVTNLNRQLAICAGASEQFGQVDLPGAAENRQLRNLILGWNYGRKDTA